MLANLSDKTTYECVKEPSDMLKKSVVNFMDKFNETKINISDALIENKNIPRAYGLIKLHKIGHPAKIIVPYIDSPIKKLSNYYKNILTAACPRPQQVIKNSNDFKEKIQNIKICQNHVMASAAVESMFPSIPFLHFIF